MTRRILFSFFWIAFVWGILDVRDLRSKSYAPDEQLILVGVGALNDGFYDIAEKQFSQFTRDYPNHQKGYEVCYLLAKTLFHKKK